MAVKRPKKAAKHHVKKQVKKSAPKEKPAVPSEIGPQIVSSRTEPQVIPKDIPEMPKIVERSPLERPGLEPIPTEDEVPDEAPESERDVQTGAVSSSSGRSFEIGEAVEFGWKKVKERPLFFAGIFIFSGLLSLMANQVSGIGSKIVLTILHLGIMVGFLRVALDVVEGKRAEFKELFSCFSVLHWYILGGILYGLIVFAGFILLIIPGIIWMLAFSQWSFVIVDKRANPLAALKQSLKLTHEVKGKLFVFMLVVIGINILGVIALLIGVLLTAPLSAIAAAHVYAQLRRSA